MINDATIIVIPVPINAPANKVKANIQKLMCAPPEGSPPVLGSAKGVSEVGVGLIGSMGVGVGVISAGGVIVGVGVAVGDGVGVAGGVGVGVFVGVGSSPNVTST